MRLVNDAGDDVPDGEVGELLVDAPSAGEGYWNQRSKSRQTFEGHWTRTGDKYIRDADGRYTFCGRSDDMFKVSGIWVSPFEVESALITHPAVLEAAVVPEADPEGLLKPKAFVVLRAGASTDGLHEALKEHVKQKIGPWKYPRWIDVVDSLPKTATGKIQRFKLRDGAASSPVVPANAGTHTPRPIVDARCARPSVATNARDYGSLRSQGRQWRLRRLDHFESMTS